MKKSILYPILAICLMSFGIKTQAPQKFSYQAVIRNGSNVLIANTTVGVKISILQSSTVGAVVYAERHTPTTNANGLATFEIGSGTVLGGTMNGINWGSGMDRVIHCLQEWRSVIENHEVEATAVVATSAVRDASNRAEFLARVKAECGLEVELITGEEEARRTLLGIRSGLPVGVTDILALDIGGGSTEFILDRPGHKPIVQSFDIGVVRLCERILQHDPPTGEVVRRAREWVARETKAAMANMDDYQQATFVGTAGTITAHACYGAETVDLRA